MKFGVFTDLHYDSIPDGDRRVAELLRDFKEKEVDFVIELGDLCHPIPENRALLDALNALPCFFSLGNHNTDFCPPETALRFLGLKRGYYSMVREDVKFLFLDANYCKTPQGFLPESREALKAAPCLFPYVPPEQLDWLRDELSSDAHYYVVCSHQSLSNDFKVGAHSRGIANREEVRAILEERNRGGRRVLFCMNGNDHGSGVTWIHGIPYYTLNSASYLWHGQKAVFPYGKEIHERYPYLKDMILYREPLHSIVTIGPGREVLIEGMRGHYLATTPEEVGIGLTWNGVSILPETAALRIPAP